MTDNQPSEKILSQIAKMLSLAKNNSNIHEATNALSMAQKLMLTYNLDIARFENIGVSGNAKGMIIEKLLDEEFGNRANWHMHLVRKIVKANFCDYYLNSKIYYANSRKHTGYRIKIVGREMDVDAVIFMINNLVSQIDRMCDYEYKRSNTYTPGKSWKNGWRYGAAVTIGEMLDKMAADNSGNKEVTALTISRGAEIKEYTDKLGLRQISSSRPTVSSDGYNQGLSDGKRININKALK